ncbi:MAG: transposase [Gemmataceae bacterium]
MSQDAPPPSSPPPSPSTRSIASLPIDALVADDPAMLRDVVRQLLAIIEKQQRDHDALRHQFDQLKRRLFGPKSEKSDPHQLLLFPEMQADDASPDASPAAETTHPPAAETPDAAGSARSGAATKNGHGRKGLHPKLRREERVHDVPESERRCPTCKVDCILFGEDVREQLDYVPASLYVVRHVCRKYACPKCHDYVAGASRPESPIERGLPGPGLLAQVVVSKYADHLPLHRLERIFGRHGVELSRSTMCDWMKAVADLARPLHERMIDEVLLSRVVHTDDTKVPWQNPESPGKTQSCPRGATSATATIRSTCSTSRPLGRATAPGNFSSPFAAWCRPIP